MCYRWAHPERQDLPEEEEGRKRCEEHQQGKGGAAELFNAATPAANIEEEQIDEEAEAEPAQDADR